HRLFRRHVGILLSMTLGGAQIIILFLSEKARTLLTPFRRGPALPPWTERRLGSTLNASLATRRHRAGDTRWTGQSWKRGSPASPFGITASPYPAASSP